MADLGEMKVKIGADITELLSKVEAAKAKLNQLTERQGELKGSISTLNNELKFNEKRLSDVGAQLRKLVDSGKGASNAAKQLRIEVTGLTTTSKTLGTNLGIAKTELAATTAQIKTQTVALKEAEKSTTGFAGGVGKAYSGLKTLANILPGLGIGALVSIVSGPLIDAFKDWYDRISGVSHASEEAAATTKKLKETLQAAFENAGKEATEVSGLIAVLKSETETRERKLAALKELQKINPEIFNGLKLEKGEVIGLDTAYKAYLESLKTVIAAKLLQAKLEDKITKLLKIQGVEQTTLAKNLEAGVKKLAQQRGAPQVLQNLQIAAQKTGKETNQLTSDIEDLNKQLQELSKGIKVPDIPDPKGGAKAAKTFETINDVLEKLRLKIEFLSQKEILFKTDETQNKIKAIEGTIDHLLEKFKLTAKTPVILNLRAQLAEFELKDLLKQKFDRIEPVKLPFSLELDKNNPFPPGSFDETILRDQIQERLKKLKIKFDINGLFITSATSLPALQKTLTLAEGQLQSFSDKVSAILNDMNASILEGLGSSLGNAFSGQGDVLKGLSDTIFSTLGATLIALGKVAIETGIGIKAIKAAFQSLNPFVAIAAGVGLIALGTVIKNSVGSIPKFASGGEIKGPGSGTSDSILARVSKGEYIIPEHVVKKHGVSYFDKLIRGGSSSFSVLNSIDENVSNKVKKTIEVSFEVKPFKYDFIPKHATSVIKYYLKDAKEFTTQITQTNKEIKRFIGSKKLFESLSDKTFDAKKISNFSDKTNVSDKRFNNKTFSNVSANVIKTLLNDRTKVSDKSSINKTVDNLTIKTLLKLKTFENLTNKTITNGTAKTNIFDKTLIKFKTFSDTLTNVRGKNISNDTFSNNSTLTNLKNFNKKIFSTDSVSNKALKSFDKKIFTTDTVNKTFAEIINKTLSSFSNKTFSDIAHDKTNINDKKFKTVESDSYKILTNKIIDNLTYKSFINKIFSIDKTDKTFSKIFSKTFDNVNKAFTNITETFASVINKVNNSEKYSSFKSTSDSIARAINSLSYSIIKKSSETNFNRTFATIINKENLRAYEKYSSGGAIKGPGTGTSDSILARVSKGEYIIKAATVSKFGVGFFDKLNKGVKPINYEQFMAGKGYPRFALGGFVSPSIVSASPILSALTNNSQVFIPNVKLRGQDLVIAFNRAQANISRNG